MGVGYREDKTILCRHEVNIQQLGEKTKTVMKHFLLCGKGQLHDLHTTLRLDHPEGEADQLHKCIVSDATGHGVFDGNVQVNKHAQRTDAGQLSRNLLLVPKATVNVKPNLQIIADDVKCTHGCAVCDLSDDELFYFRARGIDAETARQALVYSFGAEVVQLLGHDELVKRMRRLIEDSLGTSN
jgi:Fe-S cluster assembly protein SufD